MLALDRTGGRVFGTDEVEPAMLFANLAAIAIQNARQYENIRHVHTNNLRTLCTALNAKDYYTLGHTARVAAYLMLLCRELGWPDEIIRSIGEAAYLHDIGKIAISDRILTKAGKLNDREGALMRQHPVLSAEIVRPLYGDDIVLGVRHHHERHDGRGYPDGLAGEDIPAIARAMCVVDSYDAMSFERPYHRALSYSQCRDELERCKGSQFDPLMVDAFLRVLDRIAATRSRALAIAELAAAQIDGDLHRELAEKGAEGDSAYRRIVAGLRAVLSANPDVRFITTMAERDGRYVFVCDTETDEGYRSHLGDDIVNDEEIAHTLAGERPDLCVIAADEFGVWNSAMAPIRRRNGDIVGVSGRRCCSSPRTVRRSRLSVAPEGGGDPFGGPHRGSRRDLPGAREPQTVSPRAIARIGPRRDATLCRRPVRPARGRGPGEGAVTRGECVVMALACWT